MKQKDINISPKDRIVKASISIQKVAYEIANARDKAFKAGEIKDGKTTDEWNEYRKAKVKLSQEISKSIKEVELETRKEVIKEIKKLETNSYDLKGAYLNENIDFICKNLSITNKEKQK